MADAYSSGEESVKQICERFGITPARLYQAIRTQGVALRSQKAGKLRKPHSTQKCKPERRKTSKTQRLSSVQKRADMIARLYNVLDQKLSIIEERSAMSDDLETSENERQARTLASLVRLFDKLVDMETHEFEQALKNEIHTQTQNTEGYDSGLEQNKDAEQLRAELAERLARLQQTKH